MIKKLYFLMLIFSQIEVNFAQNAQFINQARFRVLVLFENGGHHILFSQRAKTWLDQLAADSNFSIVYVNDTKNLNDSFLSAFQLFLQLDYVPYGWTNISMQAFQKYMSNAKHGWLGFHHASLLGEFDGYPMWSWFSAFMGGIRWKDYIATFADGNVHVEDSLHPSMRGIPSTFLIGKEEWYTYDRSPRSKVHVIASVDESSYQPPSEIKMGDHPVIWSNGEVAARNLYIFMGHSPILFDNTVFTAIFRNAIFWAAHQN